MRRSATAALALLFALPLLGAADKWWDFYKRGVEAVNGRNYEAGASALQRAIAEVPTENTAARARNEIFIYVPHFYLGIAKFNLGDVDAALREWKISEDQGAIQNTDYYARLREWVNRAQVEKQRAAQNAAADSRNAADSAIKSAFTGQVEAISAGADRTDTFRAAQRKLQEALDQFNKAGTDVRAYHRAGETAAQARDMFQSAAAEARKLKASRTAVAAKPQPAAPQPAAPQQIAQTPPPQPQPQAPPVAVQAPPQTAPQPQPAKPAVVAEAPQKEQPAIESEALVAARVALQRLRGKIALAGNEHREDWQYQNELRRSQRELSDLDQQLRASSSSDASTIKQVADRVAAIDRELASLVAKAATTAKIAAAAASNDPRTQLESAYRAFATGDFAMSEQILTRLLTVKPLGEAYLLRGCSRYTRAMLSRKPDALLPEAASDFKAALKLNRSLRLDRNAFSPKLVAFFEELRKKAS